VLLLTLLALLPAAAHADSFLIENVRIFDGTSDALYDGNVLVIDGVIAAVSPGPIEAPVEAIFIDGEGRTLSPGFIDIHAHLSLQEPWDWIRSDLTVAGAVFATAADYYLDAGFTTVRDAGGTHPDLARAVDAGLVRGPRIFPAGHFISQTSGHGDARMRHEPNPYLSDTSPYTLGNRSIIADGVDAHLSAVRENLKNGATQIKIQGGGGVNSEYDPIHTLQPSPAEIQAAVQAAGDWDTYVMAHAYTAPAIRRLVENGVRSIEHGLLIDEETAQLVKEYDVVISTQVALFGSADEDPTMDENRRAKSAMVRQGLDNLIRLIQKYDITTGFGTDFAMGEYPRIGEEFTARAAYWTPAQVLQQATAESAEVIRMSGKLNTHGDFGEIREGWVADLVLIDGDPLEDISVLESPDNIVWVMKAGEVFKDER
jgi:imidazolonepropionase-like amidohydrolase